MTDPNIRHAVCPECDTYQVVDHETGRLEMHDYCAGGGDYPSRAATTATAYAIGSQFQSCPAATGEADPKCPDFPDGAHRCAGERDHIRPDDCPECRTLQVILSGGGPDESHHTCTCSYTWYNLAAGTHGTFTERGERS